MKLRDLSGHKVNNLKPDCEKCGRKLYPLEAVITRLDGEQCLMFQWRCAKCKTDYWEALSLSYLKDKIDELFPVDGVTTQDNKSRKEKWLEIHAYTPKNNGETIH